MQLFDVRDGFDLVAVDDLHASTAVSPAGRTLEVPDGQTAFGVVAAGDAMIHAGTRTHTAGTGMYFAVPGPAVISGLFGMACLKEGYRGLFALGGPVEARGRLKYIDGCSDTVLLSPTVLGDPCLNLLYAPPGTTQSAHTHPSVRVGLILEGRGFCRMGDGSELPLTAGSVFILPRDEVHSFHTRDLPLKIAVFHPDSDFGPTDEAHPMVNRTLIGGVSVAGDLRYQTQDIG